MSTLFSEFEGKTKAEWLAKVEKDLKGKPLTGLDWDFYGTTFNPFFHQDDLDASPSPLSNGQADNSWEIGERIIVSDHKMSNEQALFALERGANALCFELEKSPKLADLEILLKDIQHEWISTNFILKQDSWKRLADNFIKVIQTKGQNPHQVICSFQFDGHPFSNPAETTAYQTIVAKLPKARFLSVDVTTEKDTLTALAIAIYQGNQLLSFAHDHGLEIKNIHEQIQFSIGLGDDYFFNIAKIRALKLLWQQVLTAWQENNRGQTLSKRPTPKTPQIEVHLTKMSQTDNEHFNKIKATSQAMSAVIGGANRLYIHPSDAFENENGTSFSRRIALNVQHLMQQESYLDRVVDPAAGSYYLETLTDNLAEKAWEEFQKMC